MKRLKKKARQLWRAFCRKLFWWLFTQSYFKLEHAYHRGLAQSYALRQRLVEKRHELAVLKAQTRDYKKLRVYAKSAFSHGENVKYVDRVTVKLKLPARFHNDILKTIERIEEREQ